MPRNKTVPWWDPLVVCVVYDKSLTFQWSKVRSAEVSGIKSSIGEYRLAYWHYILCCFRPTCKMWVLSPLSTTFLFTSSRLTRKHQAMVKSPHANVVKRPDHHASGRIYHQVFVMDPAPVRGIISPMISLGYPSDKVR